MNNKTPFVIAAAKESSAQANDEESMFCMHLEAGYVQAGRLLFPSWSGHTVQDYTALGESCVPLG